MKITTTHIKDALLIQPTVHSDDRGFYIESWSSREFAEAGLNFTFLQDNHSRSRKNVLRGMHYQTDFIQGKLIRVVHGAVFDVIVDLRFESPTYGKWLGIELSETNKTMLWIPLGFAHGFYALTEYADVLYKCTDLYDFQSEAVLRWNDPDINIEWPLLKDQPPLVSAKDQKGLSFKDAPKYAIQPDNSVRKRDIQPL